MPVTPSFFTSTVASASTRPTRSVPGASASTRAPSNAARADAVAVIGEIRSRRPREVDRRLPGHDARPLEGQPAVLERERGVGRGRLHAQPALGPAHPRVGDPHREPAPPAVLRHLRVEAAQHEPGLALRVAQLEPAVDDLGPRRASPARATAARRGRWPAASSPPARRCRAPRSSAGGGGRAAPPSATSRARPAATSSATPSSAQARRRGRGLAPPQVQVELCRAAACPPVAREPHRSRSTRAAVLPAGVCRKVRARATSRRARSRPGPGARGRAPSRSQDRPPRRLSPSPFWPSSSLTGRF